MPHNRRTSKRVPPLKDTDYDHEIEVVDRSSAEYSRSRGESPDDANGALAAGLSDRRTSDRLLLDRSPSPATGSPARGATSTDSGYQPQAQPQVSIEGRAYCGTLEALIGTKSSLFC